MTLLSLRRQEAAIEAYIRHHGSMKAAAHELMVNEKTVRARLRAYCQRLGHETLVDAVYWHDRPARNGQNRASVTVTDTTPSV